MILSNARLLILDSDSLRPDALLFRPPAQPHAGRLAVEEFDAGFFEGAADGFEIIGDRLSPPRFEIGDGAEGDFRPCGEVPPRPFQPGSRDSTLIRRHAALIAGGLFGVQPTVLIDVRLASYYD